MGREVEGGKGNEKAREKPHKTLHLCLTLRPKECGPPAEVTSQATRPEGGTVAVQSQLGEMGKARAPPFSIETVCCGLGRPRQCVKHMWAQKAFQRMGTGRLLEA